MIDNAIETETGFGVVLLKSGAEVHDDRTDHPPAIFDVGTLASILIHERLPDGKIMVLAEGGAKLRIHSTWEMEDRLRMGLVSVEMDEPKMRMRESDTPLVDGLRKSQQWLAWKGMTQDVDYEDASNVSMRIAESLAIELSYRQKLIEVSNAHQRLDMIWDWLHQRVED